MRWKHKTFEQLRVRLGHTAIQPTRMSRISQLAYPPTSQPVQQPTCQPIGQLKTPAETYNNLNLINIPPNYKIWDQKSNQQPNRINPETDTSRKLQTIMINWRQTKPTKGNLKLQTYLKQLVKFLQDKLLDSAPELPDERQSSTSTLGLDPQQRGGEEVTWTCICQRQTG